MALTTYPRAFALVATCEVNGAPLTVSPDGARIGFAGPASAELKELVRAFLGQHEGRELSREYRAMVRLLRATPAVRDLLVVPVRFIGSYPVPYTARGTIARGARVPANSNAPRPPTVTHWAWSTSRAGFDALVEGGVAAFTAKELERAAYALERGRAGPREMARWCGSKVGRDWVLTAEHAGADLPGYCEGKTFSSLTVGDLMDGLSAELVSVEWKE